MLSYNRSTTLNNYFLTRRSHTFEKAAYDAIQDGNQADLEDALKIIDSRSEGDVFADNPSIAYSNFSGYTLLLFAIWNKKENIANYLLEMYLNKAGACLWVADKLLCTPLWWAIEHGYDALAEKLLNHANYELIATYTAIPDGANCFTLVEQSSHTTVLQNAVNKKREKILDQILKKIAPLENAIDIVNVTDNKGNTLLHEACRLNNVNMAALLLQHKCFVNNLNSDKQTALHIACQNADIPLVKLLLQHSADIYKKDVSGKRPFAYVPADKQQGFYDELGQAGLLMGKNLKKAVGKSSPSLHFSTPFLAVGTQFSQNQVPAEAITSRKDAHAYIQSKIMLAREDKILREQTKTILALTRLNIEQQKNSETRRRLLDFYMPLVAAHDNLQTLITTKFNLDPEFLAKVPVQLSMGNLPLIRVNIDEEGDQQIDINDVLKPIPLYVAKILQSLTRDDEDDSTEEVEEIDLHCQEINEKIALLNTLNDNRDDILQLVQILNILHDELAIYGKQRTMGARVRYAIPYAVLAILIPILIYSAIELHKYDKYTDDWWPELLYPGMFALFITLVIVSAICLLISCCWCMVQTCDPCRYLSTTEDSHPVSFLKEDHTEHLIASLELLQKFVDVFHENHAGAQLDYSLQQLTTQLHDVTATISQFSGKLKEMEQLLRQIMAEEINVKRAPTHHSMLFSPRNLDIFKPKEEDNDQSWLLERRHLFDLV